ncbi:DUF1749 domain-containing protein [Klebsiella pneumoniae]|uniref:DUF1749 domain-containing protein n=1 Tax=Klebsiella pneumoniae TaxID=573 RepID=UPI001BA7D307|nr:DUF1749 domain-containing protein [Klebsiella pneumoniae]MBQ5265181.1 DUF1749 domain-containing protein [Klebsiella pneumoniae]
MINIDVVTHYGRVLHGAKFTASKSQTVVIAITGVHGNFYSNPFYYTIGETLSGCGIDFIYAQTRDAFGKMEAINQLTGEHETIGSWNEDLTCSDEDISTYIDYAELAGYKNIILAGHSLGANKVIYYLSKYNDRRVTKFILLSPANIKHLVSFVSAVERETVQQYILSGRGQESLPFDLFGWLPCIADTAYQWIFDNVLNNVHVEEDGDFAQVAQIKHSGALIIGTYDRFTYGDPIHYLKNINDHMSSPDLNKLVYIEHTGHTYQQKEQQLADIIAQMVAGWVDK